MASTALQPGVPGWVARQKLAALARQAEAREAAEAEAGAEGDVALDYSCRWCTEIYTLAEAAPQGGDAAYCSRDCREAGEGGGAPRCSGTTAAGEPCGMVRLKGSLFCYHHDPERRAAAPREQAERLARQDAAREAMAAARRREAWAARLETCEQLRAFVAMVTREVYARRIGAADAQTALDGARLLGDLLRPRRRRPRGPLTGWTLSAL